MRGRSYQNQDELASSLKAEMPSESPVDLDLHAKRIAGIVIAARRRAEREAGRKHHLWESHRDEPGA